MKLVIILIGLFGCLPFALATDAASKEAMTQTQQDLKDPVARKKMLSENPK